MRSIAWLLAALPMLALVAGCGDEEGTTPGCAAQDGAACFTLPDGGQWISPDARTDAVVETGTDGPSEATAVDVAVDSAAETGGEASVDRDAAPEASEDSPGNPEAGQHDGSAGGPN